ncbi:MAG: class I SAM-dependent methyltransferase, partial [Bacteroidales bacterium]|nr:class I SAM-dependent methyltransferase [Bacteroidales bacterium]
MKRIAENLSLASFESNEQTQSYIEYSKKSSKIRYGRFFSTLKKLDITGSYLDIGSGPGLLTQSVAELYSEIQITGVDISREMVDFALSDRNENLKSRLSYAVGDACKLESLAELGKFNLIYSTFTMHHWDNAKLGIENLYSMLNPGGTLYIYDLKRVWWLYY